MHGPQQAALSRDGHLSEADIENIAEAIESFGRSEKCDLIRLISALLLNLIQRRYHPTSRRRSFRLTIEVQRLALKRQMGDSPSLRYQMNDAIASAYARARIEAARETDLNLTTFPNACPWTYDEIIDDDFWPKA